MLGAEPERRLDVLFLLRSLGYVRLYDPVIRLLLERGHSVHLLYDRPRCTAQEAAWLDGMKRHPRFSAELSDALARGRWAHVAGFVRRFADHVYFLGPDYRGPKALVERSGRRARPRVEWLMSLGPMRSEPARRAVAASLALVERAMPVDDAVETELRAHPADVLAIVPHLMPGSRQGEYVRVARTLGVPICMCIASWDNLSSKQRLPAGADTVVVWNDFQKREAVEIHGIPEERVTVTGAQSFDQWFDRAARPREKFLARVGLDPSRPYLLYVGGALFRGELTEAEFVRDVWIPQLRSDPRFADVGILIRPHPRRLEQWSTFETAPREAVWPREGLAMPVDEESRADFFDSIHHSAAVVGLNTSAMIEAAIVGRPVHTILVPEFAGSQTGTFHFDYLVTAGGGLLRTATSFVEHRAQLLESLQGRDVDAAERRRRFLTAFARPHGLDVPALPFVVDAIEQTAAARPEPVARRPLLLRLLWSALEGAVVGTRPLRRIRKGAS